MEGEPLSGRGGFPAGTGFPGCGLPGTGGEDLPPGLPAGTGLAGLASAEDWERAICRSLCFCQLGFSPVAGASTGALGVWAARLGCRGFTLGAGGTFLPSVGEEGFLDTTGGGGEG